MRTVVFALATAAFAVACSTDDTTTPPEAGPPDVAVETGTDTGVVDAAPDVTGFPRPAGAIAINFSVDDTANKLYGAGELAWKGSMKYDATTRLVTRDPNWTGPWAPLYDDGGWDVGGHEPKGATAGDHKWGITVFAIPPTGTPDAYEYGLNDVMYQTDYGNGWLWEGANGAFNVAPGATADIDAKGMTIPAGGTTDLQLTIDLTQLGAGTWDKSKVTVKGSGWIWAEMALPNCTSSSTTCTFTLSEFIGAGKKLPHTSLLKTGSKAAFVFVFNGKEYKDSGGVAYTTGVSAATKAGGQQTWSPATVMVNPSDKTTYVNVP